MREMKFRAWDKEKRTIVNDDSWSWFSDVYMPEVESDRHVLMQSIGINDKNGKSIFEGDILTDGRNIRYVEYDQGRFRLRSSLTYGGYSELGYGFREIMGNIYENKNIMEQQDISLRDKEIESPTECRSTQHKNSIGKQFLK